MRLENLSEFHVGREHHSVVGYLTSMYEVLKFIPSITAKQKQTHTKKLKLKQKKIYLPTKRKEISQLIFKLYLLSGKYSKKLRKEIVV